MRGVVTATYFFMCGRQQVVWIFVCGFRSMTEGNQMSPWMGRELIQA